jgi:hypothetical protein
LNLGVRCASDSGRDPASVKLGVTVWRSWKQAETKLATIVSAEHFGQHGRGVVVADYQPISGMRVKRQAGMAQMGVHDPGLVLSVVINPKFQRSLLPNHEY